MIGTNSEIAWFTTVPIAPDELSTRSRAGERRSRKVTAPSAASTGSRRATFFISLTASFTRWMAGCDLQPNAERRKRALNSHAWPSALATVPGYGVLSPCAGGNHPGHWHATVTWETKRRR